jgi:nucleoside-diphosphate-sugar epimerase
MKVSIIGTNGFLSNCIGKYCNKNNVDLVMWGRTAPTSFTYSHFKKVDLLDDGVEYKELLDSDIIIYAAGGGIQHNLAQNSEVIYQLNVFTPIAIVNFLESNSYSGKFVSFGSYFEIGENSANMEFDENQLSNSTFIAPSDYTVSKRTLTRFFNSIRPSYTFYHLILPTIYGEMESANRLIPYTLNALDQNIEMSFTSGDQVRQYLYINDAVEIIFEIFKSDLISGVYNFPCSEEFSVKELVSLLFELKKKPITSSVFGKKERSDEGMKILKLNAKKLLNDVKYKPNTTIAKVYNKYNFER